MNRIPNELTAHFDDIKTRRKLIELYGHEKNYFVGENANGEEVHISISAENGIVLQTMQDNGWLRLNYYDKDGYALEEMFAGRWRDAEQTKETPTPETNLDGLTPYRVTVTETLKRTVVIFAEDSSHAVEIAENLCNDSEIELNYDDFDERSTECRGTVESRDLALYDSYSENGKLPKNMKKPSLDHTIHSAEQKRDNQASPEPKDQMTHETQR